MCAGVRIQGVETIEPVERAIYLSISKAGVLQLLAKLIAVRLEFVFAIHERFKKIHEYVEHGFLHALLFGRRE